MKVAYSNLNPDEVDRIRKSSLLYVPGTMKEDTILAVRILPLVLVDLVLIYIIVQFDTGIVYPQIRQLIEKVAGISGKAGVSYLLIAMIYLVILATSIHLTIKGANIVYGFLLKKLIPFATPCMEQNKRNKIFYDATEYILRDLVAEDKIRQCLESEKEVEIYLNNNTLELHKKKDGYTQKVEIELSDRLRTHLESSNILDFTYLDEAWNTALAEKEQ